MENITYITYILFSLTVEKRCGECVAGNLADIQAHKASETCESRTCTHSSKEIPTCHLCVSWVAYVIFTNIIFLFVLCLVRLRKVKMDQRKLMDNANTITDMAKVIKWPP